MDDGLAVKLVRHLTDRQRLAVDALLGAVLAGTSVVAEHPHGSAQDGLGVVAYLAIACAAVSVPARRRQPGVALVAAVGAESVLIGLGLHLPLILLAGGFVMYSAASSSTDALSMWTVAACLAPLLVAGLLSSGSHNLETAMILAGGSIVVGWLGGENARARRRYAADLAERAAERERERARRTVVEERARIARELHDVVAHAMSVIAVRSGVARRVSASQPETASEALAIIESLSRSSLAELRRLVTVLRRADDSTADDLAADDLTPAPGLADLPQLVSRVSAAGVQVGVRVEGKPRSLPPTEDLSAYRIAQEALTNVVRHSGAGSATLFVRYRASSVEIECTNPVGYHPTAEWELNGGHGIVGMRERVAVCGGEFSAGPTDRGFKVLARLPIAEEAT